VALRIVIRAASSSASAFSQAGVIDMPLLVPFAHSMARSKDWREWESNLNSDAILRSASCNEGRAVKEIGYALGSTVCAIIRDSVAPCLSQQSIPSVGYAVMIAIVLLALGIATLCLR
jgi:hypothetical protein